MKDYFESINWVDIWEVTQHYLLPNIGWFVFWGILFLFFGLALSVVFNIYLAKKNIFFRDRRYYNWIAKLWIPYIVIVSVYFFGIFGLFYGGHSILTSENKNMSRGLYSATLGTAFSSEKEKKEILALLQEFSDSTENISRSMTQALLHYTKQNNTGIATIDSIKNTSGTYLLQQYEPEIYTASVYGLMKVVDSQADMSNVKDMHYTEFKTLLHQLAQVKPERIERSIQLEMSHKIQSLVDFVYKELLQQQLFVFLVFLLLPFVEFWIYWKFVRKRPIVDQQQQELPRQ